MCLSASRRTIRGCVVSRESEPRSFAAFLMEQGSCESDLTDAFAGLVDAVMAHSKAGTLTLKLTVKPAAAGDAVTVTVADQITVKAPSGERAARIFFALPGGGLSRRDPRQMEFPGVDHNGEVLS